MSKPDDLAFPRSAYDKGGVWNTAQEGMTKREYFAGLAMQGLLATHTNLQHNPVNVAHWAVENADALLAELAKS